MTPLLTVHVCYYKWIFMLLQLQLIMWVFVAGRALEIQKEGACMWHALRLLRNNSRGEFDRV